MKANNILKRPKFKLFLVIAAVFIYLSYLYWLDLPSLSPNEAILKYCKVKSLNYSKQNIKIEESKITDTNYGQQFIVSGVTDKEFSSNISFFYLKHSSKGWKVTSAGTGP
ncbi:hypothetical protein [Candidatus Clostridium stratigraminis]|uniref:DUF4878 domain-containing protein n=1 Tax=Candidatus Clostridium stratigraminis TaxID=3381661 RepID=A0ABW8T3F0_9CLOT